MKLEANTGTDVITQTIELEAGKDTTIQGIPAGTDYTIYEVIPNDVVENTTDIQTVWKKLKFQMREMTRMSKQRTMSLQEL